MLDLVVLPLAEEDLWLCQGSLLRVGEKSQSSAHVVCSLQLQPLAQMVRSAKATLLIIPKLWCALRLECHGALPTLEKALFNHLGDFGRTFQKGTSSSIEAPFRA